MKNQTKAFYYVIIITAAYLLIYDLCAVYITSFSGIGYELMFLFNSMEMPETPFILKGAFAYIALFLRINAVAVIFYGWEGTKPKAQLGVLIALFAVQAVLSSFTFLPPLLVIIPYMVTQALSAAIAIMVLKISREKEKPILTGVAFAMLVSLGLIILMLTGLMRAMEITMLILIVNMVLSILTVLYSAGKLAEKSMTGIKQENGG